MPVVKRGKGRYAVVVEEGRQPARRCVDCKARHWSADHEGDRCSKCGGVLGDVVQERRQRWHGPYKMLKEAEAADAVLNVAKQQGTYRAPTKLTLSEFLVDRWLPSVEGTVSENTYASYSDMVRVHVVPWLGHVLLPQLGPEHLNACYAELRRAGRLSATSIRYVHRVLSHALHDAVRWHLIVRSPAVDADPPKVERTTMRCYTPPQLRTYLAYDPNDRLQALWTLAITTGARRGELCALAWDQISLDDGRLAITRALVAVGKTVKFSAPKTRSSERSLTLDPATVAVLRAWRKRQLEERLAAGGVWEDTGLVFTTPTGQAINPKHVSSAFKRRARGAGLPEIRFHDLRHSYASAAIAAGESYKTVQERLGHSTPAQTLNTYSHVSREVEEAAAHRIAASILESPS